LNQEGGIMGHQQVLLRGGSRKNQILIATLLIAIGLVVLDVWRPGAIASILSGIFSIITSIYDYMGDILNRLREIAHNISGWYR
jgi:hypothetical protein